MVGGLGMDIKLDVNKVVHYLTVEIAEKAKSNAIAQTKIAEMQTIIDNQKEMIDAFEDKEKLEKGEGDNGHKGNRN